MSTVHSGDTQPHRAQWKTRSGFLFAAIGSAVGLGNIWRFPYVAYENGGGAFLIPYFVALIAAGIPLMILEHGLGHKMRGSAPMAFAKISPNWEWVGWWTVIFVMFGISLYYAVVISWCVDYLFFAANLSWGADPNTFFFKDFLGTTSGPGEVGDLRLPILFSLLGVWLINWVVVFFGVQKGIEKASKIFIPVLVLLTVTLTVWTLFLPGAMDGIKIYLTPDFSKLGELSVWGAAFAQIFFTLSIGFGIMIAYASYLPRKCDINANATITCLANSMYSLVAGVAVFGTLGFMAQQSGKPFSEVVTGGPGLAFVAYPQAISTFPSFAKLFGVCFFLALIVAGVSSLVSILEAFTAAVVDKFHYPRRSVVTVLSMLGFLGGMIFTSGGGLFWLDIVDHCLSEYGLFFACILQCLVVGWIYKAKKLREHVNGLSKWQLGNWWEFSIKFLIPGVLLFLVISGLAKDLKEPYEGYSWLAMVLIGRDWLLLTLIAALFVAARPWRKKLNES